MNLAKSTVPLTRKGTVSPSSNTQSTNKQELTAF